MNTTAPFPLLPSPLAVLPWNTEVDMTNPCLNTDSYKLSHYLQLPAEQQGTFSYIESRGGLFSKTLFAGLQAELIEMVSTPITMQHVEFAKKFADEHGEPFNYEGFKSIVEECNGYFPVRISALPEGSIVETHRCLVTVETDNEKYKWCVGFLEKRLLRAVWYMSSVATLSWHIRQSIMAALEKSGTPAGIWFKLHDFGGRGVSSLQSAGLGDCGHLYSFKGTDTPAGILAAMKYYGAKMVGFSIPAAEHSTITVYGRAGEARAYRKMLELFARPGSTVAVVSDSYDIENAVTNIWGKELRQEVIDSGATVVIRPDSGDPVTVVMMCIRKLDEAYGSVVNDKGYRVLNHVRVIQGDGINARTIDDILEAVLDAGYSADNIAFGMGGELLQGVMRDDNKYAMKCSAALMEGIGWIDVFKDPITDPNKRSKKGRQTTLSRVRDDGSTEFVTVREDQSADLLSTGWKIALELKYDCGKLLNFVTFEEVQRNAGNV